jgi:hypothetical protein
MSLNLTLGLILGTPYILGKPDLKIDIVSEALNSTIHTYSTSLSTFMDISGKISYCPNNLVLNSNNFSSQEISTTKGTNYILSFYGSGSISIFGITTINGNNTGTRSYLKFTATSSSIRLDSIGNNYNVQLEAVTYKTTPSTYIATQGKAYYGPRINNGVLIEPYSYNFIKNCNNPELFNTNSTLEITADTYPDGSTSGLKWKQQSIGTAYSTYSIPKDTVSKFYTFSCFVKKVNATYITLSLSSSAGTIVSSIFNLDNGTVESITPGISIAGQSIASSIENQGSFYRVWIRALSDNTNSLVVGLSFTGNTLSEGKIWGLQCEPIQIPTSLIVTGNSGKSRNSDIMYINYSPLSKGCYLLEYKENYTNLVTETVDGTLVNSIANISTPYGNLNIQEANRVTSIQDTSSCLAVFNYNSAFTSNTSQSLIPTNTSYLITKIYYYSGQINPQELV